MPQVVSHFVLREFEYRVHGVLRLLSSTVYMQTTPFYYILSSHGQEQGEGPCYRLRTDPFWDGMTMSRKRLLVGRRRNDKDEAGMVWVRSGIVFSACGWGSRSC